MDFPGGEECRYFILYTGPWVLERLDGVLRLLHANAGRFPFVGRLVPDAVFLLSSLWSGNTYPSLDVKFLYSVAIFPCAVGVDIPAVCSFAGSALYRSASGLLGVLHEGH